VFGCPTLLTEYGIVSVEVEKWRAIYNPRPLELYLVIASRRGCSCSREVGQATYKSRTMFGWVRQLGRFAGQASVDERKEPVD